MNIGFVQESIHSPYRYSLYQEGDTFYYLNRKDEKVPVILEDKWREVIDNRNFIILTLAPYFVEVNNIFTF